MQGDLEIGSFAGDISLYLAPPEEAAPAASDSRSVGSPGSEAPQSRSSDSLLVLSIAKDVKERERERDCVLAWRVKREEKRIAKKGICRGSLVIGRGEVFVRVSTCMCVCEEKVSSVRERES